MNDRRVLLYFSWSRPAESHAPLTNIEDRFPAIFELRRLFYPKFEPLSDSTKIDQGIAGFLDHVQKPNFQNFVELAEMLTGNKVVQIERTRDTSQTTTLDTVLQGIDTLIVISFDSVRTHQTVTPLEVAAIRQFLDNPDHLIFVCPHHDIGESSEFVGEERVNRQTIEYRHHGDHAIPPRQGFGGFARRLLAGLGVPVQNQFGLKPAVTAEGVPAPLSIDRSLDVLGLLRGVDAFHLHPHLPQLERIGPSVSLMDVLARQRIDLSAPPHPFTQEGRATFDALLQSKANAFAGKLFVCDVTLFSSNAGGLDNLRRLWNNVIERPRISSPSSTVP
jgi:hypothetical protein